MYTFSSKLKTFSFILMILGVLGIGYGFFTAPKNTQEVEVILAASHGEHGEASSSHNAKPSHDDAKAAHGLVAQEEKAIPSDTSHNEITHTQPKTHDSASTNIHNLDTIVKDV